MIEPKSWSLQLLRPGGSFCWPTTRTIIGGQVPLSGWQLRSRSSSPACSWSNISGMRMPSKIACWRIAPIATRSRGDHEMEYPEPGAGSAGRTARAGCSTTESGGKLATSPKCSAIIRRYATRCLGPRPHRLDRAPFSPDVPTDLPERSRLNLPVVATGTIRNTFTTTNWVA